MTLKIIPCILTVAMFLTAGCATSVAYRVPDAGAEMVLFDASAAERDRRVHTDVGVQRALDRRPLARFPTSLAVVRVQAPNYQSHSNKAIGSGKYSVLTQRDIETDDHLLRLRRMPMVREVTTIPRLLIPQQLTDDLDLRQAAGKLHADIMLLYTVDTQFTHIDQPELLNVLALGTIKDREIIIRSTVSAMFVDTRNGYVYGVAEASDQSRHRASGWTEEEVVDRARLDTETKALDRMLDGAEDAWQRIVRDYADRATAMR